MCDQVLYLLNRGLGMHPGLHLLQACLVLTPREAEYLRKLAAGVIQSACTKKSQHAKKRLPDLLANENLMHSVELCLEVTAVEMRSAASSASTQHAYAQT